MEEVPSGDYSIPLSSAEVMEEGELASSSEGHPGRAFRSHVNTCTVAS